MAQRRKAWSQLSPSYRRRLERRGVTASTHRTADLRVARGHTPRRPARAAPLEATARAVRGGATDADRARLERFARGVGRPGWLPRGLTFDVAAALSQLRGTPSDWAQVRFVPAPGGQPWGMIVTPKGAPRRRDGSSAYDQVILIPGGGAPGTGAHDVLDLFSHPETSGVKPGDPRWRGWTSTRLDVAERDRGVGESVGESAVGYGERADVLSEIDRLLAEFREVPE